MNAAHDIKPAAAPWVSSLRRARRGLGASLALALALSPALALSAALMLAAPAAQAGAQCRPEAQTVADVERSLTLAVRTREALDASGAEVVVLARAGQDLSRWGQTHSHVAFAYAEVPATAGQPGVWRVVHKLQHCGQARSALYRQGLGEFFLDKPHRYQAAFVPLQPALQPLIKPRLEDNLSLARWHTPHYSMLAYPWAGELQQSNQWLLETLAGLSHAAAGVAPEAFGRQQARDWLRRQGYEAPTLDIDAATRLGARLTMPHVSFDDHPAAQRFAGRISTVTADSVLAWLLRSGFGVRLHTVP